MLDGIPIIDDRGSRQVNASQAVRPVCDPPGASWRSKFACSTTRATGQRGVTAPDRANSGRLRGCAHLVTSELRAAAGVAVQQRPRRSGGQWMRKVPPFVRKPKTVREVEREAHEAAELTPCRERSNGGARERESEAGNRRGLRLFEWTGETLEMDVRATHPNVTDLLVLRRRDVYGRNGVICNQCMFMSGNFLGKDAILQG